ncbi:type II secretion system F family protein [Virgibacillus sp. W0430]|uniref:type II secretion system F family protein n=1 Tax=Virgibacillus sp. W0430 TaxID=3391580 RepID=UPI003F47BCA8
MEYYSLIIILISFIGTTLLIKYTATRMVRKQKYRSRLKKYGMLEPGDSAPQKKNSKAKEKTPFVTRVGYAIEKGINLSKYEPILTQSGVQLSAGELFIGRIMTTMICMLIGYFYAFHFVLIILLGVIGFQLPVVYVKKRRKKRLQRCSEQLGDVLGTMANALRAGFSFMQTMKMVADEVDAPLGPEFANALKEINYGVNVEDAFANLIKRLPDKELEIVLNTILIQRSSGGNLTYLLETMQETIIDRGRVKDEVQALTAQGKMSSIVVTLLPILLAVYIRFVNPEYFFMLFSHPLGWGMVIIGVINIILGWLFIKKIVHIEV